ncbi:MAG: amidase family protein [Corynebacterium provencense]|jgi:aspartyl-tRNA(Asn)/glutamyl-tRNA(Gln) amidotransferase subunit A|uniref:amidase n=1 Tax=Corynebacterium provencense TaxID=1737425 RepID=UPI002989B8E3|nr:amidase family protein [Corynebacterium provencense]
MTVNPDDYAGTTATELRDLIASGSLTCLEVAEAACDRIGRLNPDINAYVCFDRETVLKDAAELDRRQASGAPLGPLHGVPFAVKCLTEVAGLPHTHALVPFADNVGEKDATVVARLRAAGGLFTGLTNAPECGYYGGTDGHLFGATHNPWKHGYSAGGSSGGSAAAVAAGMVPLAEGADGAGSVRIPSALCGVVGFKPSLGRIPQTLVAGKFSTYVFHGPIARTVEDATVMFDVMNGFDPSDPMSLPKETASYPGAVSAAGSDMTGMTVAYSPDLHVGYVDPEVDAVCREAVKAFTQLGATVTEATPEWDCPEQAMWDGIWVPGIGLDTDLCDWGQWEGKVDANYLEIIAAARSLPAVDAIRAQVARSRMYDIFCSFMADFDLLVSPTLASAAFPLDQFAPSWLEGEPLQAQLLRWLFTYPFNMTTTPAITVPAGFTASGLPVGLQIAARHRGDVEVLAAARAYESVRPWAGTTPDLGGVQAQ